MERKLKDIIKEGALALSLATAVGIGVETFLVNGSKNYVKQIKEEISSYLLIEDGYSIDDAQREDTEYRKIKGHYIDLIRKMRE